MVIERPKAERIARYFITLAGKGEPVPLTQMHLHKLLYYAQGARVGATGEPLFDDAIEAWRHGPVVRPVYRVFKVFGRAAIPFEQGDDGADLRDADREHIERVWRSLRRYSAVALSDRTHRESPWKDAWGARSAADRGQSPITIDALRRHFGASQDEWCRGHALDPVRLRASLAQAARGEIADIDLATGKPPHAGSAKA